MNHRSVAGAIALTVAVSLGNAAQSRERRAGDEVRVERTFSSRDVNSLKLTVLFGEVKVYADSPDSVKLVAVRHAERGTAAERHRWLTETRVDISQQNGSIQVKDIVPEALRNSLRHRTGRDSVEAHLTVDVHLPARLALDVSNSAGDVRVEGSGGGVAVHAGAGSVSLANLRCANRAVTIDHGAGEITLSGQVGDLRVTNGAGEIKLSGVRCSGANANLHVGTGEIDLGMLALPSELLKVDLGIGEIHVSLPAGSRATVSASTGNGSIDSGLRLTSSRRSGGSLKGEMNGGGSRIEVHSGLGEVHLSAN